MHLHQPTLPRLVPLFVGLILTACGGGNGGGDESDPPAASSPSRATPTPAPTPALMRHGDVVSLAGAFGTNDVTKTMLGGSGGAIESQAIGATVPNGGGWTFNNLGGPTSVRSDSQRGKVLFTPEDATHYNAVRRYDPGFAIAEQRYVYKAHYVRNVLLLDGAPYTKSYQWKHERIHWQDSVTDSDVEIKVHNWPTSQGPITLVNRSASDKSTYWGGAAADSNGGWALMEILLYTGTLGGNDGKLITRVHKNGRTTISQNRQAERIYADPNLRLRYFVEQNYFGNFGQIEDGVDNTAPKPQVRELWSDDSQVIVGNNASARWKRVELRDKPDLANATVRELQDWSRWNGGILLRLNAGGLARGTHNLFLVVIDGVDANGWDVVAYSQPVRVQVD
ncbi:hypothetical protein [Chitinolyticbacter meiyuanensis]|uniref:hypothetical protein n=1 Tax=Chitinolyticbacter meiyuanensis TaxID=682798 RepID=UPI0011E5F938|nr:hypothetical protein [Chitinolyticbacter meiyuanensis]